MRIDWDTYGMLEAFISSMRSNDPSTTVGTCILDEYNNVIAKGYNGFPVGLKYTVERMKNKNMYIEHAERNALHRCVKIDLNGCKLYTTYLPCNECAKAIASKHISEVIIWGNHESIKSNYQFDESYKIANEILIGCNITVRYWNGNIPNLYYRWKGITY